jgi:hypothetical protein
MNFVGLLYVAFIELIVVNSQALGSDLSDVLFHLKRLGLPCGLLRRFAFCRSVGTFHEIPPNPVSVIDTKSTV